MYPILSIHKRSRLYERKCLLSCCVWATPKTKTEAVWDALKGRVRIPYQAHFSVVVRTRGSPLQMAQAWPNVLDELSLQQGGPPQTAQAWLNVVRLADTLNHDPVHWDQWMWYNMVHNQLWLYCECMVYHHLSFSCLVLYMVWYGMVRYGVYVNHPQSGLPRVNAEGMTLGGLWLDRYLMVKPYCSVAVCRVALYIGWRLCGTLTPH